MNTKKILTGLLLGFVAISVLAVIIREYQGGNHSSSTAKSNAGIVKTDPQEEIAQNDQIIVYYFHGNVRCQTCKKIEALTAQAVNSNFAEQLKDGSIVMKIVNLDDGNEWIASGSFLINSLNSLIMSARELKP